MSNGSYSEEALKEAPAFVTQCAWPVEEENPKKKIRRKNLKPEMRFRHALSAPEWRKYLEEQENEKRQIEEEKKRKFRERVEQRKKKKEDEEIKKRERLLKEQQKIAADKKKKRRKHC